MKLDPEFHYQSEMHDMVASIEPKDGVNKDDLDFDLHLQKDYLGVQSTQLLYRGKGKLVNDTIFKFSGPINMMKL
jgi:hypothetical protein